MRHIRSLEQAQLTAPSVVTIGAFDGVHRGHQFLIQQLVQHAQRAEQIPVVLTFYPHPRMVLRGFEPGFYLSLPDEKAELLGQLGVELVVTHPFNDEIRQIRAAQFVDSLLNHLNMRSLWVGEDFALGYQREGDVPFLREQGHKKGFELRAVDLMDAGSERVSSSRVRQSLANGHVEEASRLLGRPHSIRGEVIEGEKRGRKIGFPTANLDVPVELAIPARGVYAGWSRMTDGTLHPAVINIGLRPTFDGTRNIIVEAHLLDYSADLYGQTLQLYFTHRLRDEKKFDSIEALTAQIKADAERGRTLLDASDTPQIALD